MRAFKFKTTLTKRLFILGMVLLFVVPLYGSPLDVVPLSAVTHTAINSGPWSAASTWSNGVPGTGARVYIPSGKEVIIDQILNTRLKWIRLEGKLVFAQDRNTQLLVESIVGTMSAILEIGTKAEPIAAQYNAKIVFIDEGPLDLVNDYGQFAKGMVMMGQTDMHGAAKLPWTSLAVPPVAGQALIELSEDPVGWAIGDAIVVAGTQIDNPASDEKRLIENIVGRKVYLNDPLSLDHVPPSGYDLEVHVANLSRNILLESENANVARRGHLMYMHNLNVRMENVRMHKMGRTNKRVQVDDWFFPTLVADVYEQGDRTNIRGRYSLHFHRGGVDPVATVPALIKGCVVEDDPGWSYVNHSSNVDFIENVSYNVVGGAFQTESGDEIGSFVRNIALRTVNPDYPLLNPETVAVDTRESSQDFAFQGDGFWFHGGGVSIVGNVSSGNSGHGFIFWTEGQREVGTEFDLQNMFKVSNIPNGDLLPGLENIQSWWIPIKDFSDNTAYASVNGLAAYYVHATIFEDITELTEDYLELVHTYFKDLTIWNVGKFGIELQNCERFTFENVRIINERLIPESEGIRNWVTVANESNWKNIQVKGFEIGMIPPMQGKVHICGGQFSNETDLLLLPPQRDSRVPGQARDLRIEGVAFGVDADQYGIQTELPIKMAGAEALSGAYGFLDPEFQQRQFLIPDRIVVNLKGLDEKRLYYHEQAPEYVPIQTANIGEATGAYRSLIENRTNLQIYNQTGLAFAGGLMPDQTFTHNFIEGGVASNIDISMKVPACHFIQEAYYPANFYDDFDFMACWSTTANPGATNFQPANFSTCLYEECTTNKKSLSGQYPGQDVSLKVNDSLELASLHTGDSELIFHAGQSIVLKPGFEVKGGVESVFKINPCPLQIEPQLLDEKLAAAVTSEVARTEITEDDQLKLTTYPNPVSGSSFAVQITSKEVDFPDYKSYRLKLYDLEGRMLFKKLGEYIKSEPILVKLGNWPSGNYFLEIVFDESYRLVDQFIKH